MKICSRCGAENEVEDKFCSKCGEELKDNVVDTSKPIDFSNSNNNVSNDVSTSYISNATNTNEPILDENIINNQVINHVPVTKPKKKKKWLLLLLIPIGIIVLWLIGVFVYAFIYATVETLSENSNDNTSTSTNTSNNNTVIEDNNSNDTSTYSNNSSNNAYKLDTPFTFDELEITISSNYSFVTLENKYSEKNGVTVIKMPITVKNLKNETHHLNRYYYTFLGSQGTELDKVYYYFDESIEDGGDLRTGASYTKYFYILYDGDGTYTIEFDDWHKKIDIDIDIKK